MQLRNHYASKFSLYHPKQITKLFKHSINLGWSKITFRLLFSHSVYHFLSKQAIKLWKSKSSSNFLLQRTIEINGVELLQRIKVFFKDYKAKTRWSLLTGDVRSLCDPVRLWLPNKSVYLPGKGGMYGLGGARLIVRFCSVCEGPQKG